jgi:hypothetical protein
LFRFPDNLSQTDTVYDLSLRVISVDGCSKDTSISQIIYARPFVKFRISDSVSCSGSLRLSLIDQSISPTSQITFRHWDLDDGGVVSTLPVISHEYSRHGIYNPSLYVKNARGCISDTLKKRVVVFGKPTADFSSSLQTCAGASISFVNLSQLGWGSSQFDQVLWDFGDGKTSTLTNPNNTYVFPGTYSVSMTITDEFGCISDTTLTDYLTIFGPQAQPDWSTIPGLCGQDIAFTLGNTTNVTNVVWTFDNGTTGTDTADFIHTYLDVSTFFPSVTVVDSNNCQVLYPLDSIVIPENGLNAQFTASSTELSLGDNVIFDDVSTFGNPLVSWTWTLGANPPTFTNNSGISVSNYYVIPGPQVITLLIEDNIGCFDSYTLTINVDGSFELPNVFTPGDNDVNNTFSFKIDIFESWNVLVVNRWGSVMTEKRNQTGTLFWDGTSRNGKPAEDGVYFYILDGTLKDGSSFKKEGYVQLFGKQ